MSKRNILPVLLLVLLLVFSLPVMAHTPILYVEDLMDGSIYLQGGFSDGSNAADTDIYLVANKEFAGDTTARDDYLEKIGEEVPEGEAELYAEQLIIYSGQLDDFGEAFIEKPAVDYFVVLDAGEGHQVEKDGPKLTDSEK